VASDGHELRLLQPTTVSIIIHTGPAAQLANTPLGLENIVIFSKISKISDVFNIFYIYPIYVINDIY